MNRRGFILGLGVIAALTSFAVAPARADSKRVALVIGNSTYRNVPTLPNPGNDAADIAAALNRLGFAVTVVTNASFDQMRRSLIALGRDAAGADMAAVYFAGHGMEISGENWLIPTNTLPTGSMRPRPPPVAARSTSDRDIFATNGLLRQASRITRPRLVVFDTRSMRN